jgi:hypothetical protein
MKRSLLVADLRTALAIITGVALGIVAGLAATFPLWIAEAGIYHLLGLNRFWGTGAGAMALFMGALYAIWLLVLIVVGVVKRAEIRAKYFLLSALVAGVVTPIPSIWFLWGMWSSCVGHHGGQCGN